MLQMNEIEHALLLLSIVYCVAAKRDRTCACIVSHTYKQIRKLWDNQEKVNNSQKTMRMVGKFDADIDRSTSSDTGQLNEQEFTWFFECLCLKDININLLSVIFSITHLYVYWDELNFETHRKVLFIKTT